MNKIHLFTTMIVIFSLCLSTIMASTAQASSLTSDILYVGGTGPSNYSQIQDAIDDASNGDTVFVFNGTYYENVLVDKSIQLIGEDNNITIIDASGSSDVVKITADDVILTGFTFQNSGDDYKNDACVEIVSNGNNISNVRCLNSNYGIWVRDCTGNTISNTFCDCYYDGIWMINSGNNILRNNSMVYCGVVLDGGSLSDFIQDIDTSNMVNGKPVYYYKNQNGIGISPFAGQVILVNCSNCIVYDLDINDVTDGIEIMYSHDNIIENNIVENTSDFGIRLVKSSRNTIRNNIFSGNPIGIGFTSGGVWAYDIPADCHYNVIQNNEISNSLYNGVYLDSSNRNTISQNDFIDNERDAKFINSFGNRWVRNYWGRPRLLPKPIFGKIALWNISIPWINFDWCPLKFPNLNNCNNN